MNFEAKINGVWHPIELLDTAVVLGQTVAVVKVTDGTKPFTGGTWSAPFIQRDEGFVSKPYIREMECQHKNLNSLGDNNPLNEGYICSDCGAWLDENGNVVRKPVDEIPY
jgi:hypothetical protein